MLKRLLVAACLLGWPTLAHAETACTLLMETKSGEIVHQVGAGCEERIGPASTFKLVLAVIGFDAGILKNASEPAWEYKEEYGPVFEGQDQTMTPWLWLKASPVWYSRLITAELGMEKFADYVARLDYGNGDVSGDPSKNNGLTHSWLNRSLQVSPMEQARFMQRLLKRELPVSDMAMQETLLNMPQFLLADGWTLWGKTGTGYQRNRDGSFSKNQYGWFVGNVNRSGERYIVVHLIKDAKPTRGAAGPRARDELLATLDGVLAGL